MRFIRENLAGLSLVAVIFFSLAGCDSSPVASNGGDHQHAEDGHDHDGHDHDDHDHAGHGHAHDHPPHGPNHGHIFNLDSEEYQGEWCKYKDNNVIRMFIVDAKGTKNVPVKIDSFTVTPKIGADEESFELKAEEADENGLAACYMLDDELLFRAIPLGVDIEIKSGDQVWKGEIKAHKPLDH